MLRKVVNEWSIRDEALCSVYNRKVDLHTWYLPPRYIPLTLFSNLVCDETKKAIATTVLKYPKTDFRIGKPELQKYTKTAFGKDSSIMNCGYFLINQEMELNKRFQESILLYAKKKILLFNKSASLFQD